MNGLLEPFRVANENQFREIFGVDFVKTTSILKYSTENFNLK